MLRLLHVGYTKAEYEELARFATQYSLKCSECKSFGCERCPLEGCARFRLAGGVLHATGEKRKIYTLLKN